jgi:antitoxin component YwqK of YwqJK toxin-antitoxin module
MSQTILKPRRRWHRWLTQFSLRSLLMLVTLSGVACWWHLQPETRYEELTGYHLKLRRQVRLETGAEPDPFTGGTIELVSNAGSWRLYDEFDEPIADGRYDRDQPQGKWVLYYPNGQRAAEGRMERGRRTGLWKTWDEAGRPLSEVTYLPNDRGLLNDELRSANGPTVKGGVFAGGGGFCGCGLVAFPRRVPAEIEPPESWRHGPCRAWHPTGTLRFEGQYDHDQRVGLWRYFDEQGNSLERGTFIADRREGPWIARDGATGIEKTIEYIAGRTIAEHEVLIAGIRADLASGSVRREVAAIRRLEELGPQGVPLLIELLDRPSSTIQHLALRTLAEQQALPGEALPRIAALADHADPRLALRALVALYLARPEQRSELVGPLLAAIDQTEDDLAFDILLAMCRADEAHRGIILPALLERIGAYQAAYYPAYGGMPPDHVAQVAELGWGVLPHLESAFRSANGEGRWCAILVLHLLVASGEPRRPSAAGAAPADVQWPIPEIAQPLLERAKADYDPRVREAAHAVGHGTGGFGSGGGSGMGFSAFNFGQGFSGPAGGF